MPTFCLTMYRAFRTEKGFKLNGEDTFKDYERGKSIYTKDLNEVTSALRSHLEKGGTLNGAEIQSEWFPEVHADIFVSHSHSNVEMALRLAGYLNRVFGLRVFVDAAVWGKSLDLLKMIDDDYSWLNEEKKVYSYTKSTYAASHVHMMLACSLTKMIDKSECVFFLDSNESISSREAVHQTKSPWIYYELATIRSIRLKPADYHRPEHVKFSKKAEAAEEEEKVLEISYPADFSRFSNLHHTDFNAWVTSRSKDRTSHPLDLLYDLIPFPKPINDLLLG